MGVLDVIKALAQSGYSWIDKDGVCHYNKSIDVVFINNSDDLGKLSFYDPGTIAATIGFDEVWHKYIDGEWRRVYYDR